MRQLLYPVPPVPVPSPPPAPLAEVRLAGTAGPLVAWHLPAGEPGAPAVVFFHGNGENLETMRLAGFFEQTDALGAHVLAVDYPGYGGSAGRPSEAGIEEAADLALAWLEERHPASPRVAAGWSLGAAVALGLATRWPEEVAGVIAASPWTSLEAVAATHYPGWLVRIFLAERYDSLTAAPRLRCPALVVHGARDWIIPPAQGERLAAALPRARWREIAGAGHNDLLARPEVWEEMSDFLADVRDDSLSPDPASGG
jgi:hypothetical protein